MVNYYEVLGIDANSTEEDIRKAYRRQALIWHPDKNVQNREEAEAKFKLIAEAYEVLSDVEKRRIYDQYGEEGLKNGGPTFEQRPFQFHDPQEIFRQFFSAFGGDPFGGNMFNHVNHDFPSHFSSTSSFSSGPQFRSVHPFDPFGGFGGFGGFPSSSFSISTNSFSSGSGSGGFINKSTSTQIINGVRTTVTRTEDAEGNVTEVTESSDGTSSQVTYNNRVQNNSSRSINLPIQDGGLSYPMLSQQQYLQQQEPYTQRHQQYSRTSSGQNSVNIGHRDDHAQDQHKSHGRFNNIFRKK
ncbi:14032_t:CDS:2 [Dentiscutata erythropus]|uniref:14032_t:CDS:1 n=1 Tax=Dentiscutata erythropus TaxID=1348616 RepID=A0A9N9C100_9GLOM|nr:14032_t:CDS:2 [Dentiscutata erythropus]